MALSNLFLKAVMARKNSEPSQDILDDVEDIRQKAGIKSPIKIRIIERGAKHNAFTNGKNVYVGSALVDRLDRAELKGVIAHEIAHIKMKDVSERYLMWPPYIDSILLALSGFSGMLDAVISGNQSLAPAATTFALSYAYYKFQSTLWSGFSRIGEYRADRHAVKLTDDFNHFAAAIAKITPMPFKRHSKLSQIFKSHPVGIDRLLNIEGSHTENHATPCMDMVYDIVKSTGSDETYIEQPGTLINNAYDIAYRQNPIFKPPSAPHP